MVDVSHGDDHEGNKSTAYTELSKQLWSRDGGADYQLSYLNHKTQLQRSYSSALKAGWSIDDMKSDESHTWLTTDVLTMILRIRRNTSRVDFA